jgi:hypothetical protein
MEREQYARGDKARHTAPAPVKPCPGETRSAQGFRGTRPGRYCHECANIKDTKKTRQENVFNR